MGIVLNGSGGSVGPGVYDFATHKARLIDKEPLDFFGFAWLADSKRIVYHQEDAIIILDVDSGRRKVIPAGVHLGQGLVVSRDGRTIYTTVSREQADIWMGVAK
jgi:hypothetical protein